MVDGQPPRVLHVSQPTSEGVARCVVDLARHQVGQGWAVAVACPADGDLPAQAAAAGADVLPWAAARSPGATVPSESLRLRRLVRDVAPDVVHLHSAKAGLAGRLALRARIPTVYQPHAWSFLAVEGLVRRASLEWERRAVRWTDRVICVSGAEREEGLRAGLRLEGRTVVVPNGVDTDRFTPRDRQEARDRLGIGPGPLAVCVGRLSRQKGQDVLLDAWPSVQEAVPGAELALVGDGPDRDLLAVRAPEGVRFAGRTEPLDWYAAADVVVLPSRWEGMALVPLEAGACGRSVVVTDVAGAREAVPEEAGSAVVPPDDAPALAAALSTRLGDRETADREGELVRRHVLRHHDVRRTTGSVTTVYRDVLDAPTRRRVPRVGSRGSGR